MAVSRAAASQYSITPILHRSIPPSIQFPFLIL
jgi:hypothetical protein